MSHLKVKKVNGKFRIFDKNKEKVVGKPMDDKKVAEKTTKAKDEREDAMV